MNRNTLINQLFQKSYLLTMDNPHYQKTVETLFTWLITADRTDNDITSLSLKNKTSVNTLIKSHQEMTISGLEEIEFLIKKYPKISFKKIKTDGQKIQKGEGIAQITGDTYTILSLERIILNILGRMTGIATQTNKFVQILKNSPYIAATRKTPWMLLDKKAVSVGGGLTHRLDLADGYLIKDNHLQILKNQYNLKTEAATVRHALKDPIANNNPFIEIEVNTLESVPIAIEIFSKNPNQNGIIMLDNWKSQQTAEFIKNIKLNPNYSRILFESSGNINEENLTDWIHSGVDVISSGALTHSSKNADISMDITSL